MSWLGREVALGPSWVRLAVILALLPLNLVQSHHLWWRLVWLGSQNILSAVIVSVLFFLLLIIG